MGEEDFHVGLDGGNERATVRMFDRREVSTVSWMDVLREVGTVRRA